MHKYLILTVGTGTAGKHSNLAAGLRSTLELIQPARFWLVPSTDEVSQVTADLVREELPAFVPWNDSSPYHSIRNPDSLEDCQQVVRNVISRAKQSLPKQGRLLVNPTSGTKQMSVGATLAALDEGVGELVFTVGRRADGVVITGTERLETFNASDYFAERDLKAARELSQAGAHSAAAALLSRHSRHAGFGEIASCLHEWERQNYSEARRIAAASCADALIPLRHHLEQLHLATKSKEPNPLIIADLLFTAELFHERQDYESSLVLSCRALEMGLRRALFEFTGLCEPYSLSEVCSLSISQEIKDRCRYVSNDGTYTILNLRTIARILSELHHPIGDQFENDNELKELIRVRNELMHQVKAIQANESKLFLQKVKELLTHLALPSPPARPSL